ncbi:tRNA (N6-isopentenyl adenosine(37)-C2)-methylthiotransferase MiaB [bacterium]|nr:tRNA (N6-isopentenyl adenosine(37)-C2)-methylthiotransferase MiaB [bacterium]MBU1650964.1 tRNA (N6-isopentenyl adenosine(37)-C2)-methylthiotransferase MiaB [bacterium]
MPATKIYLDTYGCQMNLYDGELVTSLLDADGFIMTHDEASADVILINTCAVRGHAEQRALGRLRTLAAQKRTRRELVVGVLGCMAENLRENLRDQIPGLDFVVGPDAYRQLPNLIQEQLNGHSGTFHYVHGAPNETYSEVPPLRREGVNAWVAIMRGCDNFCSYCIVPYVRGRERSRSPQEIISEVETAVAQGFPEVTLLGQNVNSYTWPDLDFPDLLGRVAEIKGLKRLQFITSHPKDLSDKLINRMASGGVLGASLHLPAQSGSDRILKAMNRGYTSADYLRIVDKLREAIPGLALTTDLLCGFPGETQEDLCQTLDLIRQARFDDAFTFKYSERPGTAAAKLEDDVPEKVKVERLERMIDLCRQLSHESRQKLVGRKVEVLIENPSPKNSAEWTGRTRCDRVAIVPGNFHRGESVTIKVAEVRGFSLWGNRI